MPTDSELKHAIILPLTNYVAISNVVFTDFHGQEEGEDPDFDEQCRKQSIYEEQLYQAISDYIAQSNQKAVLEGQLKELEYTSRRQPLTDYYYSRRRQQLQQALDTLKKGSE